MNRLAALAVALAFLVPASAEDWPQLQHDPQRTGFTRDRLTPPFQVAWYRNFQPQRVSPFVQPVVAGGRCFVGTMSGNFYALDAATGKELWKHACGSPIMHAAACAGGKVFFAALNGTVYALDAATGKEAWTFAGRKGYGFSAAPLIARGRLFIGQRQGTLYALRLADGEPLWTWNAPAPIFGTAAYWAPPPGSKQAALVLAPVEDVKLWAFDAGTGEIAWTASGLLGQSFKGTHPVVAGGAVLVRPMMNHLVRMFAMPPDFTPTWDGKVREKRLAEARALGVLDGQMPDKLLALQDKVEQYFREHPFEQDLFLLKAATGEKLPVVPHFRVNSMHGPVCPPALTAEGDVIIPWTYICHGWARMNLATRRAVELIIPPRPTNADETLHVSVAGRYAFFFHYEEGNANHTGIYDLAGRKWLSFPRPPNRWGTLADNIQPGGHAVSIAGGRFYHVVFHQLACWESARAPAAPGARGPGGPVGAVAAPDWQAAGRGPKPVGGREDLRHDPRAGGLGLELATTSWPRIRRRPVPYYGIDSYAGSVKRHLPQGDFGVIQPMPGGLKAARVTRSSWTHVRMRFDAAATGKGLDAWIGRLSPAAVFHTNVPALRLFVRGKAEAAYLATRVGKDLVVRPAAEARRLPRLGLHRTWLLVWFGRQSGFQAVDFPWPTEFRGWVAGPKYPADCPMLVILENAPTRIEPSDGGIALAFDGPAGHVAVMPLFGQYHPKAAETEKWAAGLPADVAAACDFWAEHLAEVPVDAAETYAYDEAADRVTITDRFTYRRVRPGGRRLAPLPPMVALARRYGLAMELSGKPAKTSVRTPWGPYEAVESADAWTLTASGLGKYALEHRAPAGEAKEGAELRARLEGELTKLLDAGHLAPWYIAMTDFGAGYQYYWRMQNRLCWSNPGETLYTLAEVLPLLSGQLAERTRQYMHRERRRYPPETVAHTPVAEGARRERYLLDKALLAEHRQRVRRTNFHLLNGIVPADSLYHLAAYHRALGTGPDADEWVAAKAMLRPYLKDLDWATGGFLKRPGASHFTMEGPGGAPDVNAHFAGLVGYIRLARLAGDRQAETLGWGLLARTAMLRFAMARYARYLQDSRLYVLPAEADWFIRFSRGSWTARLYTYHWTQPLHDTRTFARMDQFGVQFDDTLDWYHGTGLPKLRHLTPELARFLKDHLRPEVAEFVRRVELNSPNWYLALATAFVGAEFYYQQPQESYTQFLARAWILDEAPDKLERYLDVPWMKVGDLYHLHKLAEAIKARRGTRWVRWTPE